MSAIATAIVGGAIVGGIATNMAAGQAADATTQAAQTAAGEQQWALQQEMQMSQPYRDLGSSTIPTYQALLGTGPQGSAGIQQTLQNLPGYQFQQRQGTQATEAALNAEGMGLTGNAATALSQFNQGLASSNYQSYLQDLLAPIQIGQGAAAGQAANIQTGATNLGNIAVNQGNTLAGIYANQTAGITNALGQGTNNLLTYQTLQNLNANQGMVTDPSAIQSYMNTGGTMSAGGGYTYNVPGYP